MATTLHIQTKYSVILKESFFLSTEPFRRSISLLYLMHVIACAHASTLDTYSLRHWNEENERKIKNIKLNS